MINARNSAAPPMSNEVRMLSNQVCCLCSQIAGSSEGDLIATLLGEGEYVRRVAIESAHFAVLPSLGPLAPGHVLLCSKDHYKSFAAVPADLDEEFEEIKRMLAARLEQEFGSAVHFFEHGSAPKDSRIICTVDHAHLHCVPADIEIWPMLSSFDEEWVSVAPFLTDMRLAVAQREYLYYESPNGLAAIATSQSRRGFESQIMRRTFSQALGRPDQWNWRTAPAPELADVTFRKLTQVPGSLARR